MLVAHLNLLAPLSLTLCMAWADLQSNRIPNILTLGGALAGLGFQLWYYGWPGLLDGLMGLGLGFVLLISFCWLQTLGPGDVKALAALGAWLGPWQTATLFIYVILSGVCVIMVSLWRQGLLLGRIKRLGAILRSWATLRAHSGAFSSAPAALPVSTNAGVPYAVVLALGMTALCFRHLIG